MILQNPIQDQVNSILKSIKRIRQEKSISQYEMANRLNISQNAYFKIEKGTTKLDLYRFILISNILEFKVSSFIIETIE